jgi:hypothetical protein
MGKLIQKIVDPGLDPRPVLHPALPLEDVLTQPAPQLLNGIEPGGIGGQLDRFDAGGALQGDQHVRMGVNVPVVLDHIEPVRRRIGVVQMGVEPYHLLAINDVAIQVVHLPRQGLEGPNGTPSLIVTRPLRHGPFQSPGGRDLRPALIPKFIQEQRHHRSGVARGVAWPTFAIQP